MQTIALLSLLLLLPVSAAAELTVPLREAQPAPEGRISYAPNSARSTGANDEAEVPTLGGGEAVSMANFLRMNVKEAEVKAETREEVKDAPAEKPAPRTRRPVLQPSDIHGDRVRAVRQRRGELPQQSASKRADRRSAAQQQAQAKREQRILDTQERRRQARAPKARSAKTK